MAGGSGRLAANMMNNLALLRWVIDGPALTLVAMDEAIAFAVQRKMRALAELMRGNSAEILADSGRIDEAMAIWLEHTDEAVKIGDMFDLVDASTCLGHILVERGELEEAIRCATTAEAHIADVESIDLNILRARLALVWLRSGDVERAKSTLSDVADLPDSRGSLFYCLALPVAMRTAAALGDVALAARLIAGIAPAYDMHKAGATSASATMTELTEGCREALPLHAEAAEQLRSLGHQRELAFSLLGRGRCLVDLGRRPEARPVLGEARELFASFGYAPRVHEVDELLALAGEAGSPDEAAGAVPSA